MNFALFDLNLLRVLDALFSEGSTIRAGLRLRLSQSAVSGALARLRVALNDPLFVRHGNRLVATEYATSIQEGLRAELERIEALLAPPAAFDPATASGTFKIAASDFFAELLMPPLADQLHRQAPGLTAQLVDLVPNNYVESLERPGVDLALIPDMELPHWAGRAPLFTSEFRVIARDRNPAIGEIAEGAVMPLETFCRLSHVIFSPEGNLKAMGDAALARVGRSRRVALTVPAFSGVCRVVGGSDLIALVPEQLAHRVAALHGLRIFRAPMEITPARIIGIWHKRSDNAPAAVWMRQQVFDLLRSLN